MAKLIYNYIEDIFEVAGGSGGGSGTTPTFTTDIVVSLQGGKTFGKYSNGDTIPSTGLTSAQVIALATTEFQVPNINAFSIQGQATLIEVGDSLSGNKSFQWSIQNAGNVAPNTLNILDLSAGTTLLSGGSIVSPQTLNIGTVSNTSPITQTYQVQVTDTQGTTDARNYSIQSIYPYFYGSVASGGAAPSINRPVANQTLIDSGTKIVASSTGTITVPFNSTNDDYIWFAIPSASPSKTLWEETALNNGSIGGAVGLSGNLFPDFDSIAVTTVNWNGVPYKVYISNFQTTANTLQLKN